MAFGKRTAAVLVSVVSALACSAAFAGTASASPTVRYLCVTNNGNGFCAVAVGNQKVINMGPTTPYYPTTDWYYPTGTAYETIQADGTDLCMQVDAYENDSVIEAPCTGASYQEWSLNSKSQFVSEWNSSLCLTSPATDGPLHTYACNAAGIWTQAWHALT